MALLLPVVSSCADSASSDLFTLSLHCALPICGPGLVGRWFIGPRFIGAGVASGTGDGRPPRRRDGSAPAGRSEERRVGKERRWRWEAEARKEGVRERE